MPSFPSYTAFLTQEFERRKKKNPSYSLRAFSHSLGVSHTVLSRVIRSQRPVTQAFIKKTAKKLGLGNSVTERFSTSLAAARLSPYEEELARSPYSLLDEKLFPMISDWKYLAILELFSVHGFSMDVKSIADALKIPKKEAESLLHRLLDMGMIQHGADGKLKDATTGSTTTISNPKKSTEAHRRMQAALLYRAIDCLKTVNPESRSQTGITMAIEKSKIEEARTLIRSFQRRIQRLLSSTENDEVYQLSISLFPLTSIGAQPTDSSL